MNFILELVLYQTLNQFRNESDWLDQNKGDPIVGVLTFPEELIEAAKKDGNIFVIRIDLSSSNQSVIPFDIHPGVLLVQDGANLHRRHVENKLRPDHGTIKAYLFFDQSLNEIRFLVENWGCYQNENGEFSIPSPNEPKRAITAQLPMLPNGQEIVAGDFSKALKGNQILLDKDHLAIHVIHANQNLGKSKDKEPKYLQTLDCNINYKFSMGLQKRLENNLNNSDVSEIEKECVKNAMIANVKDHYTACRKKGFERQSHKSTARLRVVLSSFSEIENFHELEIISDKVIVDKSFSKKNKKVTEEDIERNDQPCSSGLQRKRNKSQDTNTSDAKRSRNYEEQEERISAVSEMTVSNSLSGNHDRSNMGITKDILKTALNEIGLAESVVPHHNKTQSLCDDHQQTLFTVVEVEIPFNDGIGISTETEDVEANGIQESGLQQQTDNYISQTNNEQMAEPNDLVEINNPNPNEENIRLTVSYKALKDWAMQVRGTPISVSEGIHVQIQNSGLEEEEEDVEEIGNEERESVERNEETFLASKNGQDTHGSDPMFGESRGEDEPLEEVPESAFDWQWKDVNAFLKEEGFLMTLQGSPVQLDGLRRNDNSSPRKKKLSQFFNRENLFLTDLAKKVLNTLSFLFISILLVWILAFVPELLEREVFLPLESSGEIPDWNVGNATICIHSLITTIS